MTDRQIELLKLLLKPDGMLQLGVEAREALNEALLDAQRLRNRLTLATDLYQCTTGHCWKPEVLGDQCPTCEVERQLAAARDASKSLAQRADEYQRLLARIRNILDHGGPLAGEIDKALANRERTITDHTYLPCPSCGDICHHLDTQVKPCYRPRAEHAR